MLKELSTPARYIFPRFILYTFFSQFCSLMMVWGFSWGLGSGFRGWGFQLIGFWAGGVGLSGVLWGWGSLYKHKRINLGNKCASCNFVAVWYKAAFSKRNVRGSTPRSTKYFKLRLM